MSEDLPLELVLRLAHALVLVPSDRVPHAVYMLLRLGHIIDTVEPCRTGSRFNVHSNQFRDDKHTPSFRERHLWHAA